VQSVLNQTLHDIEIILVDDGSPDNCPAMCDEYARRYANIQVIHKDNAGLGMACNTGIDAATGEYIAFLDSDDWVDLCCYENLYNQAVASLSDAVYSGIKRVNQDGEVSPMSKSERLKVYEKEDIAGFQLGMIASPVPNKQERDRQMSAKIVLYSKAVIDKYDIRFKSERHFLSEDLLFNLDFLNYSSRISEVPEAYYYYYINTQSLSQTFKKNRFDRYKFLRTYLINNYSIGVDRCEFIARVDKMFIGYVRNAMQQIVNSSEPIRKKHKLLAEICSNDIWCQISNEYPTNKQPILKRIVYSLTRYNYPSVLFIIFLLKK
jgi:glycosyltransferase involved in cell wall biosynthesis